VTLGQAGRMLHRMFVPDSAATSTVLADSVHHQAMWIFALSLLVFAVPPGFVMGRYLQAPRDWTVTWARLGYAAVAAPYAAVLVAAGTYSPFLYYQF